MEIELIKIRNELRYGSRIYRLRKPKKGAHFYVCKTVPFCYASINIALDENGIEDMTKVKKIIIMQKTAKIFQVNILMFCVSRRR